MLRKLIAILLFSAFLLQSFQQAFTVLDYYTNTAAFAKACENKARPMLHCNGKCQLAKKLKAQEKKEQEERERKGAAKNILLSSKSFFATLEGTVANSLPDYPLATNRGAIVQQPRAIFHPPDAVTV